MTHLEQLQSLIQELRSQPSVRVADMISEPLYSERNYQGLYEVRDPEDREAIYIGKTIRAREGVAQRIWDHAKNISGLLDTLEVTPERFAGYRVRTLVVANPRFRGLAEYFGIAIFDPRGNLVG